MNTFFSVAGALWYLRVNSIIGSIKARLKRLKQPKYMAGAVVGALYFYFAFFRRAQGAHGPGIPGSAANALPADLLPVFGEVGALALFLVLAVNWCFPRGAALQFSQAEIAFLFPAPVSRRMLVHYRLLGMQFATLFTALVFTFVFGRGRATGAHAWYQFFGWWLILTLVNLHFTATSFFYARLLNRSITTARRRFITVGIGVAAVLALVAWMVSTMRPPAMAELGSGQALASYAMETLHAGPMPWLLGLPKLVIAPYIAKSFGEFALAMIPALVLFVIHYFWVVNTEVAFEEASIARADKRAARRRAIQQGDWRGNVAAAKGRKPAFELRSTGRPEIGFLWKNLFATSTFFRPRPVLVFAAILTAVMTWSMHQPKLAPMASLVALISMMVFPFIIVLGTQFVRQDLRTDLANADLLKTYPMHGWQIVLGEMLTPIAILSVVCWFMVLAIYLALPADTLGRISLGLRGLAALALAVLTPPLVAIQVLTPNAAAVLFPAWVQNTRDQTERGFEVMGQRLIFLFGQVFVTVLAILPAIIAGTVVLFVAKPFAGEVVGAAIAVIAMTALLGFEAWLGILWLGKRFEKLDISAELRT